MKTMLIAAAMLVAGGLMAIGSSGSLAPASAKPCCTSCKANCCAQQCENCEGCNGCCCCG